MTKVFASTLIIGLLATAAIGQNPTERRAPAAAPKGNDPAPTPGQVNLTGGPDGFGYTFADTAEANCAFQFVDIAASGTIVPGATADDGVGTVALSEAFFYYGQSFNSVVMDSNGLLSFNPAHTNDLSNTCPLPETTDPRITVVWDDLDLGNNAGQSARQQYFPVCPRANDIDAVAEGCTVFQWDEAEHFSTSPPFDLQAILYHTSGEVAMAWDNRNGEAGSGSTTGLQSGADSLTYACDTAASLPGNAGVCFFPPVFGGDLHLTKTVNNPTPPVGANVTFTITVSITGDNTGVAVVDNLPAPFTYVSDTCGGDFADGQWDIGAMTDGQSFSCDIVATFGSCAAATNTATVSGDLFDPPGDNTASVAVGGTESVSDGSFEGGSPNASWAEASTNFGSPLCTVAGCGTGTGTGPRTGLWWTWFGGIGGTVETGSVSQSVTIPVGTTNLVFWLEQIVCDSANDFMTVSVDGNVLFTTTGASPLCGVLGYSQQTVDISAFADGGVHTLAFDSTTVSTNGGGSNFFVDDISILGCAVAGDSDLSIVKTASGDGVSGVYTLTVTNLGPDDEPAAVVTDTLPAGVVYVSDDCGASFVDPTLTWNIGALANGASAVCNITVGIVDIAQTVNVATVSGTNVDASGGNNSSTAILLGAGPNPLEIPTSSALGLLLLALGIGIAAAVALRR